MLRSNCLRRTDALGGGVKGTRHYYSFKPKHKGRTNKSARQGVGEEKSWNEKTKETDGLPYSLYYWQGCIMLGEKREKKEGRQTWQRTCHPCQRRECTLRYGGEQLIIDEKRSRAARSREFQTDKTDRDTQESLYSLLIPSNIYIASHISYRLRPFFFCFLPVANRHANIASNSPHRCRWNSLEPVRCILHDAWLLNNVVFFCFLFGQTNQKSLGFYLID